MKPRLAPLLAALCTLGSLFASVSPTPAAASLGFGETPAPEAPPALQQRSYTFQVVVLAAELTGPTTKEGIPERAQRALADLAEFLPYKSYRLVDLAWLRTDDSAQAALAGPQGESLQVVLKFHPGPKIAPERLRIEPFRLINTSLASPRDLLSTSFTVELGETIVVGTSKLNGPSKALVVLLTVLP